MSENLTYVPSRLTSAKTDKTIAGANEILDDDLHLKQNVINVLTKKVVTLNSAPTSSTLTYTYNSVTCNFTIGDEVRVADNTQGDAGTNNYIYYKLFDIDNGVAYWSLNKGPKGDMPTIAQSTGNATDEVMSQNATTIELNKINGLIPAQATNQNQLADKDFVNSSVTTATAKYQGNYNLVNDLKLTTRASHGQIEQALNNIITGADNNDYSFVQIPTSVSKPTEIASVERYKHNGTTWSYEYAINNSGFTAAQWAAVNSNITSGLVAKLNQLSGNTQNSIANLFGMDSSGNFQNISTSNLASVLGVVSFSVYSKEYLSKAAGYTNPDTLFTTGAYTAAVSGRYGVLLVFNTVTWKIQLFCHANGIMYRRSNNENENSWRAWTDLHNW